MTMSATLEARREIVVNVPQQRAFELFTEGFDSWWPRSHHIGAADLREAAIEPRAGGRWYERGEDGSECDWGRVLAFEPPSRLLLSWAITPQWGVEPDPARASEVEVTFEPEGDAATRVRLEHRHIERHGEGATEMRDAVSREGGWGGLLELYAGYAVEPSNSSEQELTQ
jgi:uncharacterized protein YndB with AHSA1/START domain